MVPILIFESVFFVIELLYFMFADLLDTEMIAFYGFEAACLTLFILMSILLLIFFLWKDKFLITEIVLSGILIITDCIIIAIHAAIIDTDKIPVILYIFIWFGWSLWVAVMYFRVENYWFKVNWLFFNRKIAFMKRNRTPV